MDKNILKLQYKGTSKGFQEWLRALIIVFGKNAKVKDVAAKVAA